MVAVSIWLQIFHFEPACSVQGRFTVPQASDGDAGEQDTVTVPYANVLHDSTTPLGFHGIIESLNCFAWKRSSRS